MIEWILRGLAVDRNEKWVNKLLYAKFTIKSSVVDSIGKMPFEIYSESNV